MTKKQVKEKIMEYYGYDDVNTMIESEEFNNMMLDSVQDGFCIGCGTSKDSVEPDARNYPCDNCKENKVFSLAEHVFNGVLS
jgi:hypothetical protein